MTDPRSNDSDLQHTSLMALVLRLFWLALGPIVLLATAGALWSRSDDGILGWSIAYWLTVSLILGARLVDIRKYQGQTVDLTPADLGHWRRHLLILLPLALASWVATVWFLWRPSGAEGRQ